MTAFVVVGPQRTRPRWIIALAFILLSIAAVCGFFVNREAAVASATCTGHANEGGFRDESAIIKRFESMNMNPLLTFLGWRLTLVFHHILQSLDDIADLRPP